jgi:hypothetical protein
MWCWRRLENTSWTDRVRNGEVLRRVKEQRNILHTIKRRKADWIGHILRRNCLLKHGIEGKIEGTGRWRRRCKQLLAEFKEKRRYWNLKEEALDGTVWRTRFGEGYGPVIRLCDDEVPDAWVNTKHRWNNNDRGRQRYWLIKATYSTINPTWTGLVLYSTIPYPPPLEACE